MKLEKCIRESFSVIGKEGSSNDGPGFAEKLWEAANTQFGAIAHLAKMDYDGNLVGIWGAMSDFSRSFKPWEDNFTKGLYLAGVECRDDAEAPEGWTKWTIPAFEYIYTEIEGENIFTEVLDYMNENGIELVGAVHEFECPENRKDYLYFPIRKI